MKYALLLSVFLGMMPITNAVSADAFVYDPHDKFDPFSPLVTSTGSVIIYDADMTVSDMTLEGILADPNGNSAAIINGKVVKISDNIGAYQVQSIEMDKVILLKEGEGFTLKLKRGGI